MRIKGYCIVLLIIVLHTSCRKGKAIWDSEYAVPLANASLGLSEIIPDSLLVSNPDHSLVLNVEQEFYRFSLDEIVQIEDTSIVSKFNFPFGQLTLQPSTQFLAQVNQTKFDFGEVSLSKVRIKSGTVQVKLRSRIKERTRVRYRIPSASKDGVPFEANFVVPAATGSAPSIVQTDFDLSGYEFDLTGVNHNQYNIVHSTVDGWVHEEGNLVVMLSTDTIFVENSFVALTPDYGKGYFGSGNYSVPLTTSDFTFFKNIPSGILDLNSATAELVIENGIGADARAKIHSLKGVRGNRSVTLNNPVLLNTINLNRAIESPPVDSRFSLMLDASNSNIVDLIELMPDKMSYAIDLFINPLGNTSGANDFIDAARPFTAKLNLKIPLDLSMSAFVLDDTVSFSYTETEQSARVKKGTVHVFTDNGFPFDAALQLYLLDENGIQLDSLFSTASVIKPGKLDDQLNVIENGKAHLTLEMPENRIELLNRTKRIRIRAIMNTAGSPSLVKIYDTYKLGVKASAEFTYEDRW